MEYNNRKYLIFNTSELDKVDFNAVLETSSQTLRKSVDGTKTFVKWDENSSVETQYEVFDAETQSVELYNENISNTPAFVSNITTSYGIFNCDEMREILSTPEWQASIGDL